MPEELTHCKTCPLNQDNRPPHANRTERGLPQSHAASAHSNLREQCCFLTSARNGKKQACEDNTVRCTLAFGLRRPDASQLLRRRCAGPSSCCSRHDVAVYRLHVLQGHGLPAGMGSRDITPPYAISTGHADDVLCPLTQPPSRSWRIRPRPRAAGELRWGWRSEMCPPGVVAAATLRRRRAMYPLKCLSPAVCQGRNRAWPLCLPASSSAVTRGHRRGLLLMRHVSGSDDQPAFDRSVSRRTPPLPHTFPPVILGPLPFVTELHVNAAALVGESAPAREPGFG